MRFDVYQDGAVIQIWVVWDVSRDFVESQASSSAELKWKWHKSYISAICALHCWGEAWQIVLDSRLVAVIIVSVAYTFVFNFPNFKFILWMTSWPLLCASWVCLGGLFIACLIYLCYNKVCTAACSLDRVELDLIKSHSLSVAEGKIGTLSTSFALVREARSGAARNVDRAEKRTVKEMEISRKHASVSKRQINLLMLLACAKQLLEASNNAFAHNISCCSRYIRDFISTIAKSRAESFLATFFFLHMFQWSKHVTLQLFFQFDSDFIMLLRLLAALCAISRLKHGEKIQSLSTNFSLFLAQNLIHCRNTNVYVSQLLEHFADKSSLRLALLSSQIKFEHKLFHQIRHGNYQDGEKLLKIGCWCDEENKESERMKSKY